MLEFQNVFIKKAENIVLKDIVFSITDKQNVAITGPNGSGKSTLLDAIAGKIFPFKGKITKPHYSTIELVPRDYSFHRVVGAAYQYYQQRYQAYDSQIGPTVWEVLQDQIKPIGTVDDKSVDLPPLAYPEEWIASIASQMNITHLLDRQVTSLSNGETRRSLIAISLLKKPKTIVLDNPFTGLDTESKITLKGLLSKLKAQLIIVCSLNDIPDNVNKLLLIEDGFVKANLQRPFPTNNEESKPINLDLKVLPQIHFKNNYEFKNAIEFRNVNVKYSNKSVLNNINWQVKNGEKWALMGANGSGKSTLLSLITGDNPKAYQNDISLFDRKRGTGESIWDIKKKTGFVSPEMHLYFPKKMEVWKVVASGLFDTMGLFKKLKDNEKAKVDSFLSLLNIEHIKNRLLSELSTGEQRLVLLARALIKNPPLLILDEACQNLDYNHMVYFRELVNELVIKLDKTLVYVTHNEEEIPECVNQVIRLENGFVL